MSEELGRILLTPLVPGFTELFSGMEGSGSLTDFLLSAGGSLVDLLLSGNSGGLWWPVDSSRRVLKIILIWLISDGEAFPTNILAKGNKSFKFPFV